jgi:hypothetical protein
MACHLPTLPSFNSGFKKKPLPLWFLKWISKQKLLRYKDLLVPFIQFKVVAKDDYGSVNVGFSIRGKDVYGNILVFPYDWSQSLTTDALCSGFEEKLSRHLNVISKGSSRGKPQQIKLVIDSTFQVNCIISPKHQPQKTKQIILRTNSKGQVLNASGKIVGMSGTVLATALGKGKSPMAYAKSLSGKKKKKSFNPSRR